MGSPVSTDFDSAKGEQSPIADMEGSEHFYAPFHHPGLGVGYGYGFNHPNIHFAAGLRGFPGAFLPGVVPPAPFFFRK